MITCNCGAVVGNILDHYELWHGGVPKAKVRDYRVFWDSTWEENFRFRPKDALGRFVGAP